MNRKRVRLAAEGSVAQNGKLVAAFLDKHPVKASRPSSGASQAFRSGRAETAEGLANNIDSLASKIQALRQFVEEFEQNQALLIAEGATQQQIDEVLDEGRRGLAFLRENYVEMLELEESMRSTWETVVRVWIPESSARVAREAGRRSRTRPTDWLRHIDRRNGLVERGPPAPEIASQPIVANAPPAMCRVGCSRQLGAHIAA